MSSSTALLPKPAKKDDHPIFLRVCHSPWMSISQKTLVAIRGFIASYMTIVFVMLICYEYQRSDQGWLIPFELSNITYLIQVIYTLIAFSWTYMHLYYPHHGSAAPSPSAYLQEVLSAPRLNLATKNRAFFSIFYTVAVTFPHVVTLGYWLIIVPQKKATPLGLIDEYWLRVFIIDNKYGVNSFIALFEVLILSSIKQQEPIWAHIFALSITSLSYVGWAYIGKLVTGRYVYFFFDVNKIGWEYPLVGIVSIVALSNIFFAVIYGLTGVREMLTRKSENRNGGYVRLPQ